MVASLVASFVCIALQTLFLHMYVCVVLPYMPAYLSLICLPYVSLICLPCMSVWAAADKRGRADACILRALSPSLPYSLPPSLSVCLSLSLSLSLYIYIRSGPHYGTEFFMQLLSSRVRACSSSAALTATGLHMMMILLLFLQKQNLASAIYLFGLGTRLSGPRLKHMR